MSRTVSSELAQAFARAEGDGRCLTLPDDDTGRVRRALARRAKKGEVVSPAKGLYARAEHWGGLKRDEQVRHLVRGLHERHPNWVFCGPTAALMYGVDVSYALLDKVFVATTRSAHGPDEGVVRRRAVLSDEDVASQVEVVGGVPLTTPDKTVFDSLRWTDFPHGLGIADSALRAGVVERDSLERYARSQRTWRGGRERVLSALSWSDPRSENGGESIARGRMLLLGFARPELQVEVPRVVEGGAPYRADFCWVRADGSVVLGELDGGGKYADAELMGGRSLDEVLSDENIRGSRFTLYDVSLVRFRFATTGETERFSALLDEYGVPRRGTPQALPDGVTRMPDWDALRRRK